MKDAKEALREELRKRRDALAPSWRARASAEICATLLDSLREAGVTVVGSYSAIRTEVDLTEFHQAWLDGGGRLLLPRVENDERIELVEAGLDVTDSMKRGRFGILEPVGPPVDLDEVEIVLVPGLGFDSGGGRIGYGAGYYDRLLERAQTAREGAFEAWGVAFSPQLIGHVPREAHDVVLARVVTDTKVG